MAVAASLSDCSISPSVAAVSRTPGCGSGVEQRQQQQQPVCAMAASYGTVPSTAVAFLRSELDRLPSPPPIIAQPQSTAPPAKHKRNQTRSDKSTPTPPALPPPPPRSADLLNHAPLIDALCRLVERVERVQCSHVFQLLLIRLPEPATVLSIATYQSLANQLDCLYSLLGQPAVNPAESASEEQQEEEVEGVTDVELAINERIVPLLSVRYQCVHDRVVRLLLTLYTQPNLPAVRPLLHQLALSQWPLQVHSMPSSSAASLSSSVASLSVLCDLSCGLLTAGNDAAFASSLHTAVLACLLSHPHAPSRLIIMRRMLDVFLATSSPHSPRFTRQLLTVLSDRWHSAVSPTASSSSSAPVPLLLASDGVSVLGLLSFPAIPSLASLVVVHPALLDVYTVLCLYFDALSSVAASAEEWERLLVSVCSVGLACALPAVNKQSAFLLRKHALSSHAAASSSTTSNAWLTYLSILEALRTSQTHLVLSLWPRLYTLSLPAVFLGLLIDKALRSGTRASCAVELIQSITANPHPSPAVPGEQWSVHSCRYVDVVPAILSGSFLHFLNSSHGELPQPASSDAQPADDDFAVQVKRFLSFYFLSLPDTADGGSAVMSPRAVWMRHWLAAMDSTLSSHLALRQQLTVLSALPPLPAYTNTSYTHLISILSTRLSVASGLLRPQLIPPIVAMLCRHTAFGTVSEATGNEGVAFGRWCETLSLLPIDTCIPCSPLHTMLADAMAADDNRSWLEDNIDRAWKQWLALDDFEHVALVGASSAIDLSPLLSSAHRLSLAFSITGDSSTAAQGCIVLLSRALSGCYSRTYQSSLQRMRALSLLAYCIPTLLSPAGQSPVMPPVIGLSACYLPSDVILRPRTHAQLSAVVSLLADELFALCDAMLQQALVDEEQAELYRGVVLPLLFFLFLASRPCQPSLPIDRS